MRHVQCIEKDVDIQPIRIIQFQVPLYLKLMLKEYLSVQIRPFITTYIDWSREDA